MYYRKKLGFLGPRTESGSVSVSGKVKNSSKARSVFPFLFSVSSKYFKEIQKFYVNGVYIYVWTFRGLRSMHNKDVYLQLFSFYWYQYLGKRFWLCCPYVPVCLSTNCSACYWEKSMSPALIGLRDVCWVYGKQLWVNGMDEVLSITWTDCTLHRASRCCLWGQCKQPRALDKVVVTSEDMIRPSRYLLRFPGNWNPVLSHEQKCAWSHKKGIYMWLDYKNFQLHHWYLMAPGITTAHNITH